MSIGPLYFRRSGLPCARYSPRSAPPSPLVPNPISWEGVFGWEAEEEVPWATVATLPGKQPILCFSSIYPISFNDCIQLEDYNYQLQLSFKMCDKKEPNLIFPLSRNAIIKFGFSLILQMVSKLLCIWFAKKKLIALKHKMETEPHSSALHNQ